MDTQTIAEYYRESDPKKRKALLDQAIASGEDREANQIRKEIWEARYAQNEEDEKAKLQKDIYMTAVCLPRDLGMEKELALVTRAAREIYELYFPGEGGMPE